MHTPRISASAYSNTAPLIWSFLYGRNHGKVELILDNAPARSAELLAEDRVEAALVPVIAFQSIPNARLVPDVCVGAAEKVRSVCLLTRGDDLGDVRSVALDTSSRTSTVLTKTIFREFLGFEPEWQDAEPNIDAMLDSADAALMIGDPALALGSASRKPPADAGGSSFRVFDLAELWHGHTGLGFIFAMWMTRKDSLDIDFAAARDEGLANVDSIAASYASNLRLTAEEMRMYLTDNISYTPDKSMLDGMQLYFELAKKHGLIDRVREVEFLK